MPELEDTQPLGPMDLPTEPIDSNELHLALGWDLDHDGDIEGLETKVPEPAVLRGVAAAVVPLAGLVIGHQMDLAWIDQAVAAYAVLAPFVLGFWIRSKVTPVKK